MSALGKSFPLNEDKLKSEVTEQNKPFIIDCSELPQEFDTEFNLTDLGIVTYDEFVSALESDREIWMTVFDGDRNWDCPLKGAVRDDRRQVSGLVPLAWSTDGLTMIIASIWATSDNEVIAEIYIGFAPNPYN